MATSSAPPSPAPLRLGDHPALDLLNTVLRVDGALVDVLRTDEDVWRWLEEGELVDAGQHSLRGLLSAARHLRETVRALLAARKHGKKLEPEVLNAFLAKAPSVLEIATGKQGRLALVRRGRAPGPEQVLAKLAEHAAELLVSDELSLVRECESADCVLWFYDRTKSHRRRWCSMAACGNRHKVAAFRERTRSSGQG